MQAREAKMSSELTFTRTPKTEDNTSCLETGDMEWTAPMKASNMVIQGWRRNSRVMQIPLSLAIPLTQLIVLRPSTLAMETMWSLWATNTEHLLASVAVATI